MSSSRRIFAVVVLMLALFMGRATPSAAQALRATPSAAQTHGSANAPPVIFTTAAPADTGFQYLYQPLTEPDNLPPVVPPVLVTPLTSYSDYFPLFGRQAGGLAQEVVQSETRVQERTEDRIQPEPKIGER